MPPGSLAALSIGQSDLLPYYFRMTTEARENVTSGAELENPQRLLTGRFDLAFVLIYYFAPDLHEQRLRWLTPGATVGVCLWLLVSFLFGSYLNLYSTYSVVYGSLGAVIILMLWFYLTGVTILIGGEVNAIIEQAAARAGDPEAKAPGKKVPDENASGHTARA